MPKIFILDDDLMQNELNAIGLRLMGISDVDFRSSGIEALEYLEECKINHSFPQVLLIDYNMPVMDGPAFLSEYEKKYMPFNPQGQVIVLTNSILADEKNVAMKFKSVVDFWSKPLNKNLLVEMIQNMEKENG